MFCNLKKIKTTTTTTLISLSLVTFIVTNECSYQRNKIQQKNIYTKQEINLLDVVLYMEPQL